MAAVNTNISLASSIRKSSIFAGVISAFQTWNDARATRKALNSLTDRELADIGLCRGDIEGVAVRSFNA